MFVEFEMVFQVLNPELNSSAEKLGFMALFQFPPL